MTLAYVRLRTRTVSLLKNLVLTVMLVLDPNVFYYLQSHFKDVTFVCVLIFIQWKCCPTFVLQRHARKYYQVENGARKSESDFIDGDTALQSEDDSRVRTRRKRRFYTDLALWDNIKNI